MTTKADLARKAKFARIDEVSEAASKVSFKRISKGVMETRDGKYRLTLLNSLNRGNRHGVYYWTIEETTAGTTGYRQHGCVSNLDEARMIFGMGVNPFDSAACARLLRFA